MTEQHKTCTACELEKPLSQFTRRKRGKFGHDSVCKKCESDTLKKRSNKKTTDDKRCRKCHKIKKASEFHAARRCAGGISRYCIECEKLKVDKFVNTLEGHIRFILTHTKSSCKKRNVQFDITYQEVFDLYEKQHGLCAISDLEMTHNHLSGQHSKDFHNLSIDRIIPGKGYTKDNIQLVCLMVNMMKLDLKEETFHQLCAIVAQNN